MPRRSDKGPVIYTSAQLPGLAGLAVSFRRVLEDGQLAQTKPPSDDGQTTSLGRPISVLNMIKKQ